MTEFKDYSEGFVEPGSDAQYDHTFAARLGESLRQPEKLEPGFEARVLSRIRNTAAPDELSGASDRSRWGGFSRLDMSSGRALALAASLVVAAFVGGVSFGRSGLDAVPPGAGELGVGAQASAATDTVYVVRFVLADPVAERVALVGSFNLWSEDANPLVWNAEGGVWTASVRLPPGVHEYAYVVDGDRWTADPLATSMADPLGIETSILRLHANGYAGS
jgi:hypothetical protein